MMTPTKADSRKVFIAWLGALFFTVLGAKLWVVQLYGSPLPLWDQWYEAKDFFYPWMAGTLSLRDFFVPSNEHRIFFTHLLDYIVIAVNGRWEPMLQMTVNCFIHAGFVCALAGALWTFFGRQHGWLICALLAPFYALPYAAENTVWAINSQQYFMSLAALVTICGLGFGKVGGQKWCVGLVAAFAGLVTMASGFLAVVTVAGLIVLRALRNRRVEKGEALTFGVCVVVAALGMSLKVAMPGDEPLKAHTAGEFTAALIHNLAWPFMERPYLMCVVTLLPLLFLLALGLWSALQSAAIAYGRANYGDGIPASRYMDVLNIMVIAGIFALLLLAEHAMFSGVARRYVRLVPLVFAGIMLFNIGKLSQAVVQQIMTPTRMMNLIAEERVETFMDTGNEKEFFAEPTVRPDPKVVLGILQSKPLQRIMPGICQGPDHRPPPYRLMMPTEMLYLNAQWILAAGVALFAVLCGWGMARGALGLVREEYAGIIVLLTALMALGFVWSRSAITRNTVAYELQSQLSGYFQAHGNSQRAAIHAAKAEELKHPPSRMP
jgi:hypothetical protein